MAGSADDDFLKGIADIDISDDSDTARGAATGNAGHMAGRESGGEDRKPSRKNRNRKHRTPESEAVPRHQEKTRAGSGRLGLFFFRKGQGGEGPDPDDPAAQRWNRIARRIRWSAITFFSLAFLWSAGLIWFAETMPMDVEDKDSFTDAIIVLTGGSGRLQEGFDLLSEGKARKVFVSGVYRGVDVHELFRLSRQAPDDKVECCVILGYDAANTHENARETAQWIADEGFGSLRLVTANYHLRRSVFEFRRIMPGIRIVENPVFPEHFKQQDWWKFPGSFSLMAREYTKYLGVVLAAWGEDLTALIAGLFEKEQG